MNVLTKTPVDVTSKRVKVNKPALNLNEAEMRQFLYAVIDRSTELRDIIRFTKEAGQSTEELEYQLSMLRTMRKKVLTAAKKTVDIV